jgi:cytoskeletal protein CcmA (bactofilin family)
VHGNITADKLEIRSTGRVWGNVVVSAFSTEEGAFLRGQVTMEDQVDLQLEGPEYEPQEPAQDDAQSQQDNPQTES